MSEALPFKACGIALALSFVTMLLAGQNTALAQATSSIKCSNGTVTVGTGSGGGKCVKSGSVITCEEATTGGGNVAGGGCDAAGMASCGNTSGSGTCTISMEGTGGTPKPKVKVAPGGMKGGVKAQ